MTVVMPSCVKRFKEETIASELAASRPEVGSSRKRIAGSAASSKPMLTRFLWPPLIPPTSSSRLLTTLCRMWSICMTLSTSSVMRLRFSPGHPLGFRRSAEKLICSLTVRPSCTMSSWGTNPATELYLEMLPSWPLMKTLPDALPQVVFPQRTFMKVVLPAPEGPMIAHSRPARNSPVTPSKRRAPVGSSSPMPSKAMDTGAAFCCKPRKRCLSTLAEGRKRFRRFWA
mmetsp:Transcript_108705/g.232259  ORF Transcript_108705/g.232259 Transcript_108705/m.232259 type:complete len:228 (+) Transcript_108705:2242-2925(+)